MKVVGHDDSQPAGNQDTFLLDDSTLAWGQVNDPSSSAQITVTKTQSLPGVGPTDNGSFLVALAALRPGAHPTRPTHPTLVAHGAALRGVVGSSGSCRLDDQSSRKQTADLTASAPGTTRTCDLGITNGMTRRCRLLLNFPARQLDW